MQISLSYVVKVVLCADCHDVVEVDKRMARPAQVWTLADQNRQGYLDERAFYKVSSCPCGPVATSIVGKTGSSYAAYLVYGKKNPTPLPVLDHAR